MLPCYLRNNSGAYINTGQQCQLLAVLVFTLFSMHGLFSDHQGALGGLCVCEFESVDASRPNYGIGGVTRHPLPFFQL